MTSLRTSTLTWAWVWAGLALATIAQDRASAAEIALWCPPALKGAVTELAPQFEKASGHKLAIRWEVMPKMTREIDAGAAFDVAVLTAGLMDQALAAGKIEGATRTVIARTGAGLAVRKGAPKPDIGSVAGFKQALSQARSIGYTAEGATGDAFLAMLDRLGLAAEVRAKLRPYPGGGAVLAVAAGEVDVTVTTIPGILQDPQAELVGPLPSELQTYVVFTAAVGSAARDPAASRSLIAFLTSAAARAVMTRKGVGLPDR